MRIRLTEPLGEWRTGDVLTVGENVTDDEARALLERLCAEPVAETREQRIERR